MKTRESIKLIIITLEQYSYFEVWIRIKLKKYVRDIEKWVNGKPPLGDTHTHTKTL